MRFWAHCVAAGRGGILFGLGAVIAAGCAPPATPGPAASVAMFVPQDMRIHPIFTRVADLNGTGKPDGVEAQLEFSDPFGDPTKASGQVLFELFEYRRQPPYTGRRVGGPWVASLATPADQRDKWVKTLRTYRFPLAYPAVSPSLDYVLTATFELTGGGRFSKMVVLTGHKPDKAADGTKAGPVGL